MNKKVARSVMFFVVLILVVVLPWWLYVPLLIGLIVFFPLYLEALFFGFLLDGLYSTSFSFPYEGLTLAGVLVLIVYFVKTKIRT